ncbi:hypothetical protein AVEN_122332-1, partial [Araneus ventricosus]
MLILKNPNPHNLEDIAVDDVPGTSLSSDDNRENFVEAGRVIP